MTGKPSETIDAFHRGAFHVVQPKGRGHRSGMDAMLLAALVGDERTIRVADLGAGAGAAGMAVASRRSPPPGDGIGKPMLKSGPGSARPGRMGPRHHGCVDTSL